LLLSLGCGCSVEIIRTFHQTVVADGFDTKVEIKNICDGHEDVLNKDVIKFIEERNVERLAEAKEMMAEGRSKWNSSW
jgi:hypothetical protein